MNLIKIETNIYLYPKIIQQIKNINEDKDNNQTNLFESNENLNSNFEFAPSIPKQRASIEEFKSLGFYI